MGVYSRYKKSPEGFRALVELLETTPLERRQRMIEVGMEEDPEYTSIALQYLMTFEDVLTLDGPELAELMAAAPPRMTAFAISHLGDDVIGRFLNHSKTRVAAEIRENLETKVTKKEIGGAQLKLVGCARDLERAGFLKIKQIPTNAAMTQSSSQKRTG